jgi:hypothetical protein
MKMEKRPGEALCDKRVQRRKLDQERLRKIIADRVVRMIIGGQMRREYIQRSVFRGQGRSRSLSIRLAKKDYSIRAEAVYRETRRIRIRYVACGHQ